MFSSVGTGGGQVRPLRLRRTIYYFEQGRHIAKITTVQAVEV